VIDFGVLFSSGAFGSLQRIGINAQFTQPGEKKLGAFVFPRRPRSSGSSG